MATTAVFWDRDGTLIEDPGYLRDPDGVRVLPGAPDALYRLAKAGFENVVVTNQSGIARGLFDEDTLERIHERMRELFAREGAPIHAIYYCPYLNGDEAVVEAYRQDSDLRKPKPGMLVKASLERNIDLGASWMIGDSLTDVQAGRAAGCRTILIAAEDADASDNGQHPDVDFVARTSADAAEIVLHHTRHQSPAVPQAEPGESTAVLQEILSFLRMVDRRGQGEDFSLGRLAGAVFQILAFAALIAALFAWIRKESWGEQLVLLLYTVALQLMAMTFFMISSSRKR